MADPNERYPDNAAGPFFVDWRCLDCDVCRDTAPANFTRNDDGGYSYLKKQPENLDEYERCLEAMDACHTEAIGCNGGLPDWDVLPSVMAFRFAIEWGHSARFERLLPEVLLEAGRESLFKTGDLFRVAARTGLTDMVERLLLNADALAIPRSALTPSLDEAIERNDFEMVDLLFRYGVRPSGVTAGGPNSLELALLTGNPKMVERVLAAGGISKEEAVRRWFEEHADDPLPTPSKKTCGKCND